MVEWSGHSSVAPLDGVLGNRYEKRTGVHGFAKLAGDVRRFCFADSREEVAAGRAEEEAVEGHFAERVDAAWWKSFVI